MDLLKKGATCLYENVKFIIHRILDNKPQQHVLLVVYTLRSNYESIFSVIVFGLNRFLLSSKVFCFPRQTERRSLM